MKILEPIQGRISYWSLFETRLCIWRSVICCCEHAQMQMCRILGQIWECTYPKYCQSASVLRSRWHSHSLERSFMQLAIFQPTDLCMDVRLKTGHGIFHRYHAFTNEIRYRVASDLEPRSLSLRGTSIFVFRWNALEQYIPLRTCYVDRS